MKHPSSRGLFGYWRNRRRGWQLPSSHDIRAAELGSLLIDMFVFDIRQCGRVSMRFAGPGVAARFNQDVIECDLLKFFRDADRKMVARSLSDASGRGSGFVAGVRAETFGGGVLALEMLCLPLSLSSGHRRFIGSLVKVGGNSDTNRVKSRILGLSVHSMRILHVGDVATCADGHGSPRPPPADHPMLASRRYGHLRVLEGGKV